MIKDIIVSLECKKSRDAVHDYAISIAEAFDSHLAGVACAGGIGLSGLLASDLPSDVLEDLLAERAKAVQDAIGRFEAAAKRNLVSFESHSTEGGDYSPSDVFAAMARRFDLSVVMQSDDDEGIYNDVLIESALFDSGRPVIVTPYIQKDGLKLDRVLCCWDGSRNAARAVNDALPLLKKAKAVELLIVANEKTEDEIRGAEIGNHLARHDVKVQVTTLPAADSDVANVILSHVAESAADMVVMGGYGHSRLREFVLGGATRDILASMTVPVLMSH